MRKRQQRRSGLALAYTILLLTVLLGFAAFGVDYGRIQLAKTQLGNAADAAARAGAAGIPSGVSAAQSQAVQYAALNLCDGSPVTLDANQDIEFGIYDPVARTFTVLSGTARSSANAVRVTVRRTTARGNPLQLNFTRILGLTRKDLTTSATAMIHNSYPQYLGTRLTRMFNTTRFDAYNSNSGSYSLLSAHYGKLYGNTDLWLHGTCYVYGEAHWGPSGALTRDLGTIVNPGPASQLPYTFSLDAVVLGNVATVNNNTQLALYRSGTNFNMGKSKGIYTAPAGTYYLTALSVDKGSTLLFNGRTTIFLDGSGSIAGTVAPISYRPADLTIKVTPGNHVHIDPGIFYGCLYAPGSDVHHHNGGQSFGSVISSLLCFRQTSQGHADEALDSNTAGSRMISLVK